jgi:CelD/BcsL family acetyltransferase involved in cellulose biosynthesis
MIPISFEENAQSERTRPNLWGVRCARLSDLSMQEFVKWVDLSHAASPDTIFATYWFTQSSITHFEQNNATLLMIAESPEGEWLGVLPIVQREQFGRIPLTHLQNAMDKNQFAGTPLVRPGAEHAFWSNILKTMDTDFKTNGLHLQNMPIKHRVSQALAHVCETQGRAMETLHQKRRAVWTNTGDVAAYWAKTLPPKRRSRLRSLSRQLQDECGDVLIQSPQTQSEIDAWIESFLSLEVKGWKGAAGSALASNPQTASHFRFVMQSAFAESMVNCLSLMVGDKTIAMTCYFKSGDKAWGFKSCYDENYARYAPGIHLTHAVMFQCEGEKGLIFDSCSDPDAAMINELWPEQTCVADYAIETGGKRRRSKFQAAMLSRRLWHKIKPHG